MFPQLIAGPIVLYHQVADQLKVREINWRHMENGIKTFIFGLSLKMLLANTFGSLWNQVQTAGVSAASVPIVWLGALAYTFQIYFDFQGYSMMAMGLGEMLGFRIPRNFRHPYMAVSVTDFWRRWHITLSSWFKNYVYIPLGGSRCSQPRMLLNMLVVWLFTGLWHGAGWNFILWGLYYFVLLAIEKIFLLGVLEKHRVIGWCYTFLAVVVGWMIFAMDRMDVLKTYLLRMFAHLGQADQWTMNADILVTMLRQYGLYFILAALFSVSWPYAKYKKYKNHAVTIVILFALFLLCIYKLNTAASNPFLYFRF
jgi:alginate O-acetyltransferase complex protein AlgI